MGGGVLFRIFLVFWGRARPLCPSVWSRTPHSSHLHQQRHLQHATEPGGHTGQTSPLESFYNFEMLSVPSV